MTDFAKAHQQTPAVYERNAAGWDRQRPRELRELHWLEEFVRGLQPGSAIFDAGCGGGEPIAGFFIRRGFKVTGIDASESMIEMCRLRFPEQTWITMDMRDLSIDRKFAGIVAWDSFFHLNPAEQRSTLDRFVQHLLPGGALLLTVGDSPGEVLGAVNGETVYHSSLSSDEYRRILGTHGFEEFRLVARDERCDRTVLLARQQHKEVQPADHADGRG